MVLMTRKIRPGLERRGRVVSRSVAPRARFAGGTAGFSALALSAFLFAASCLLNAATQKEPGPPPAGFEPFPADFSRKHGRDFVPSGGFKKLGGHLYVFDDTCNVYVLVADDRAFLIGFGSGEVLKKLPGIGVSGVDGVLLTHHHRDQAQGLCDLEPPGFEVLAPEKEARFLEDAESFWRTLKIFLNYDCRSYWNTVRKNIRVNRKIKDGDRFSWRGFDFEAMETPGPTGHSLSYLTSIDGKRTVFCGNLISGPGKIPNWFDLHWDYYGFTQGIDASDRSFARIISKNPGRLLPAHGRPADDPATALEANSRAYAVLRKMLVPNELVRVHQEVRQILPHLVFLGANCYALLSDGGKAFLWDYGYVDRGRVEELKKRFGVTRIDAASFSHYHDDHGIRAWELDREGTEFWVYENMRDIFERPAGYRLPCLIPFPIRVDRVLHDGEKVPWEEYTLEFFHLPGQTEFHQGLLTTVDGKKVIFTGDNTWNKKSPEKTRNGPLVPHNEYLLDSGFIACARKMLACAPDLVCPAHTEEYSPDRKDLEEFLAWALELREIMTSLVDQPDPGFGTDYRWCHFYPFLSALPAGGNARLELRLRNHLFAAAEARIRLRLPSGMSCPFPERTVSIPGKTQATIPFDLTKDAGADPGRRVVTADISINGRRIGEYAEALID